MGKCLLSNNFLNIRALTCSDFSVLSLVFAGAAIAANGFTVLRHRRGVTVAGCTNALSRRVCMCVAGILTCQDTTVYLPYIIKLYQTLDNLSAHCWRKDNAAQALLTVISKGLTMMHFYTVGRSMHVFPRAFRRKLQRNRCCCTCYVSTPSRISKDLETIGHDSAHLNL